MSNSKIYRLDDNYNNWITDSSRILEPLKLFKDSLKFVENDLKINDPKIINDRIPLYAFVNLNEFNATMAEIEKPYQSQLVQQPINISGVVSIGGLQYELFWFVNNISNLDFGQNSVCRRLIKT